MVLPHSELLAVQEVSGSGRGVVASKRLPQDTVLLVSEPPSAHVIFRSYRKEVCASCLKYDRGRTLPVRLNSVGKVFCTAKCQSEWLDDQGDLGLAAWEQLGVFLQAKSKAITNHANLDLLAPKPTKEQIQSRWQYAEHTAKSVGHDRMRKVLNAGMNTQDGATFSRMLQQRWAQTVDTDVLSYLLSGILFHHKHPDRWISVIFPLSLDETPFRNVPDMDAHCNSFIQLTAIVPVDLLPSVTSEVCRILINAASHNSFGIRSGSEDGEEYMGYALYPDASYFNHSCRPNVVKKRVGNVWEFRAGKSMEAGEECCITYLGGDEEEMMVNERRQRLKEFWGFECMCARCLEEGTA